MPCLTRSQLTIALIGLLALPLVSCFDDPGDCPTCPAANSARLELAVTKNGLVDSVQVRVDGRAQVTVRRDRRLTIGDLSAGTHDVAYVRWFTNEGIASSRSAALRIRLERGEARSIVFHNDFPLITWAPVPGARGATRSRAEDLLASRVG